MIQITNNFKAFLGAAILVAVFSVALSLSGVLGDDDKTGGVVAGDTFTPFPEATSPGATDGGLVVPPSDEPTQAPSSEPIAAAIEVPILMYHQVLPELPADEFDAVLTVTDAALTEQVEYLKCAGFTAITMAQLFAAFDGRGALPEKPVILTFDDGWADHYTDAFPILREQGVVGSFGIATGFIEAGGPYMTWAQVKLMSDSDMEIMSHSVSHVDLGTSDDATVIDQLQTSKAVLEERLGKPVEFLVYPSGEPFRSGTEERQAQVVQMLAGAGYRGALLAGPNSVTQDPATPYALNRVRVSGGEDIYTFAGSIYGPSPDDLSCP